MTSLLALAGLALVGSLIGTGGALLVWSRRLTEGLAVRLDRCPICADPWCRGAAGLPCDGPTSAGAPLCSICGGPIDLDDEWVEVLLDRPMHVACYERSAPASSSPAPAVPGQLTIDDVLDGLDRLPACCDLDDPAGADELAPAPAGCGPWLMPRGLVPGLAAIVGAAQALDDRHVALTCSPSGVAGFAHVTFHGCDAGVVLAGELRDLGLDGMAGLLVDWCAGEVVEVGTSGELCFPPSRDDVLAAF